MQESWHDISSETQKHETHVQCTWIFILLSTIFGKQNSACEAHCFCTFLCWYCTTTTWNVVISCFMKDVNRRKLFNVSFLECSVLEFNSRNIRQHLTNWMSWNKSQEVWSNPNLLFVWYDVFVTVGVIVAKTPYFFSRQGMWSKIMSCRVCSLICLVIFPLIPNIVLVKMNEHRTKRTYENYTFQPLMSFWLALIVFFLTEKSITSYLDQ